MLRHIDKSFKKVEKIPKWRGPCEQSSWEREIVKKDKRFFASFWSVGCLGLQLGAVPISRKTSLVL